MSAASTEYLGVGLSYRWSLNPHLARSAAGVDWLEITPEHFMPFNEDAAQRLALLAKRFPIVGHSLELSVGSDGVDAPGYRADLARVLAHGRALWHGDHLCFTRVGDRAVRALLPLPFTEAAVEVASRNIRAVQSDLSVPFLVENIAAAFENPMNEMSEAEFLRKVVLGSDAGLLLDLHNLFANACNFHFDPYSFLASIPLDRVTQIHLAGGEEIEGVRFDTHASFCPEEVWGLLDYVASRCPIRGVNFEMDGQFPAWPALLGELERARAVLRRHGLGARS